MRTKDFNRRDFLKVTGLGASAFVLGGQVSRSNRFTVERILPYDYRQCPSYLKGYELAYKKDPREAARKWFRNAKFGLFMHFGLYSLLGRHEWVQYRETIPLAEYVKLKKRFAAKNFDADFITDLALSAQMKYITITSKHHEGFCLFETQQHAYHAKASPAKRDLIGELARACQKKGLGLFLYYSYAADWWHPYFYPRDAGWQAARPAYKQKPAQYKFQKDEDFKIYVDYVHAQLRELLTNYGPIAGIWFDPIMGYYARPDLFPMEETYKLIRSLQPQVLISFKQGATGTEDFAAPERSGHSMYEVVKKSFPQHAEVARQGWQANRLKHNEICDTLQPKGWGYIKSDDGKHKRADYVLKMLAHAAYQNCNLLLNTGPLPDGSIHPEDVTTLREVGGRIQEKGFPAPANPVQSKPKTKGK